MLNIYFLKKQRFGPFLGQAHDHGLLVKKVGLFKLIKYKRFKYFF